MSYTLGGTVGTDSTGNPVWKFPAEVQPLAEKYFAKWKGIEQGAETIQTIATDLVDDLVEARITKAKAPLQAEIKELKALVEKAKVNTREGQGMPANVSGASRRSAANKLNDPQWAATAPIKELEEALREVGR